MSSNRVLESADRDGRSIQEESGADAGRAFVTSALQQKFTQSSGKHEALLVDGFFCLGSAACFGNMAASLSGNYPSQQSTLNDIRVPTASDANGIGAEACG